MQYKPLVSIAVAVYNGEKFMRELLNSLLQQTYQNFEIIVSDDQSTDGTQKILEEYAKKDNRIIWSINPKPAGCSKNFERAFSLCNGEIIFVCDADDVWFPEKVRKHVEVYTDERVQWVYNRSVLTDVYGKEIGYIEDKLPNYFFHKRSMLENAWGSCIGGAHASYRTSMLRIVMPMDPNAGAFDSWIQLAIWPARSVFINEVLQTYRQHGNNESGGLKDQQISPEEFLKREQTAIVNNIRLIAGLPFNRRLPLWKRCFFGCVYVGKMLRGLIR